MYKRQAQLHQHHDERLAEVLTACAIKPCNAAELLSVLFKRKLDLHQTTFAMGEAIATCTPCSRPAAWRRCPTAAARCATEASRPSN